MPPAPDVHVLPIKDLRKHIEDAACWCAPRIEESFDSYTKGRVIVHNSADGRELVERHGLQ